ncbi:MAG: epoxyqueuosine reductase QueH [Clostridia bacterium]|nr:epoxyqueuosine reductase QueH [Clostridia bacterium]
MPVEQIKPENDKIEKLDKILLHICCGPCSLQVIDDLRDLFGNIEIRGLYANPNIHPYEEFERRLENAQKAAEYKNIDLDYLSDFDQKRWENFTDIQEKRCEMCYKLRMEMSAKFAAEHGYEFFSTTLIVSPYQNHMKIYEAGKSAAEKYGVKFFYHDFSINFRKGQQQAKDIGLYRQKYCGCMPSKEYR